MKRISTLLLVLALLLCMLGGCGKDTDDGYDTAHPLHGCYIYGDHEQNFMNFQLTLLENGRFTYYATPLSSYIGAGNYTVEGNVITMTDEGGYDIVNRFRFENGKLVFIEEGSSNFMYVPLEDGDAFRYAGDIRGTGFYED